MAETLTTDCLTAWSHYCAPATLSAARVMGSDTCFVLSVRYGEEHIELPVNITDDVDVAEVGTSLRCMAAMMGADTHGLGAWITKTYLAAPVQWTHWKELHGLQ